MSTTHVFLAKNRLYAREAFVVILTTMKTNPIFQQKEKLSKTVSTIFIRFDSKRNSGIIVVSGIESKNLPFLYMVFKKERAYVCITRKLIST